jgi:hypothetical protein
VSTTTSFFTVDFFEWSSTRPECLAQYYDETLADHGGVALLYTALRVVLLLVLLQSFWVLQRLVHMRAACCGAEQASTEQMFDRTATWPRTHRLSHGHRATLEPNAFPILPEGLEPSGLSHTATWPRT